MGSDKHESALDAYLPAVYDELRTHESTLATAD